VESRPAAVDLDALAKRSVQRKDAVFVGSVDAIADTGVLVSWFSFQEGDPECANEAGVANYEGHIALALVEGNSSIAVKSPTRA
jgi:hypothetical protein